MIVFEYKSYKELIKGKMAHLKQLNPKYTFDALALTMGVHKPYLSKVLNQKGNFSGDQLYKCSQYLKLSDLEKQYLLLLFEENISELPERKAILRTEIDKLKKKVLKTDSLYEESTALTALGDFHSYFLDPFYALIHMFLLIPDCRENIDLIATKLDLSKSKVSEYIETLHHMKIIEKKGKEIKVLREFVRLPENSQLITAFRNLSKLKSLDRISQSDSDHFLSLHIFFTADESARFKIQKLFLDFLTEAKKIADKTKSENVYQLNFDLLKWS